MEQIKDIIQFVKSHTNNIDYNELVKEVSVEYPDVPYLLVRDICSRMIDTTITINTTKVYDINFRNWDKILKIDEINNTDIKIPKKHMKTFKQFKTLYNTPQPEQRTKDWFDYRYNRITASDTASAIDTNPYESVESFICKKCDPNFPFLDNDFVFHGKKYEQIATSLYEHLYNSKVTEFGCVPSDKHLFLGASPDGISSKSTLDYKFNEKLGTMLEIKCPFVREITCKGEIAGGICPYYYYCQVQQQLECCDLENCDFIQCELREYKDREEYLKDTTHTFKIYEGTEGTEMSPDNTMSKGYLLQFLPKNYIPRYDGDKPNFQGRFIYPPRLTMTQTMYDEWVLSTLDNWQTEMPDIAETFYFDKVLYWKINIAHTVTIPRDREWFNDVFPILTETWSKVTYYREHLEELPLLQTLADKRKAFYKYKSDFSINNFEPNTLFLDSPTKSTEKKPFIKKSTYSSKPFDKKTFEKKTFEKKIFEKKSVSEECDFIDD